MTVRPYAADPSILSAVVAVQGNAVPALTTRIIKSAIATNTGAVAVALTVYVVPNLLTPNNGNMVISARTIAPGESYPCPELINQGINALGSVQAFGNGISFRFTAVDIT